MKWYLTIGLLISATVIGAYAMNSNKIKSGDENPFFSAYDTPFGVPPFDKIMEEHFVPAFKKGISDHENDINAIADNPEDPTFENTIVALEKSGKILNRVTYVFDNLSSALSTDNLQAIAKELSPLRTKHGDDIYMNRNLYLRIKTLQDNVESLDLTTEQRMLLKEYYDSFVRGGADLNDAQKEQLRKLNEELDMLSLQFGENVLAETNSFELVIDNEADLAGLPEASVKAAANEANERGYKGKWVFTEHKPSVLPFLTYSQKRDLREKIFKGYINRGDNGNTHDNNALISKIMDLRIRKANLLGYQTHADFVLDKTMAKTPAQVYELLEKLWTPAQRVARQEVADMQKLIESEGGNFKLQPWDWWYYAEKVKKANYDLDEEMLRPYFKLENVLDGAFMVANKLWGITFTEISNVPVYHPEVKVFEVKEADGKHIALLFTDYFPRATKRGGAWMNALRKYSNMDGNEETPLICNVGNFSRPVGDKPALLSYDEVETLFHEMGHALHGMLSKVTYPSISGTSVPRDFVELCSQIMENWAFEPEVMKMYARHYQTNEPMPDDLLAKIVKADKFNQGFKTVEYLAASILDMDWHTLKEPTTLDARSFEKESMERIGLIPEIVPRYRSQFFNHIFVWDYSSGYYSYIWAEVLDADAYEAFRENGLFDQKTAKAFRDNILATGGSDDAMTLYRKFRGADPKIEPLLERRGLN